MKKILPLLFALISISFFSGCKKEEEEVKVETETPLQFQARMLKGKWKEIEGFDQTFDSNGNIIRSTRTTPPLNDNTTYSYDGKIHIVDYAPGYNRPPAQYPYTLTEKEGKFFVNIDKLLYLKDPEATYIIEINANTDVLLRDIQIYNTDGSKAFINTVLVRVP